LAPPETIARPTFALFPREPGKARDDAMRLVTDQTGAMDREIRYCSSFEPKNRGDSARTSGSDCSAAKS